MGQGRRSDELHGELTRSFGTLLAVGGISGPINALTLTGSFFMLEAEDRLIPSPQMLTLVGLCVLALSLYVAKAALEALRARVLARIGAALDADVGTRVLGLTLRAPLQGTRPDQAAQPLRDLDQIRAFLAGSGPGALFDLPWLPAYVALCLMFHSLIGAAAVTGALILSAIALATDLATHRPTQMVTAQSGRRQALAKAARSTPSARFSKQKRPCVPAACLSICIWPALVSGTICVTAKLLPPS